MACARPWYVALVLWTALLWGLSVWVRQPWFGRPTEGGHYWLTAHTVTLARNWHEEGPVGLGFRLLNNPASVEFRDFASRGLYVSYPPGFVIPVYLLSLATGAEPDAALVMGWNLCLHGLLALTLGFLVWTLLRGLNYPPRQAFLWALLPPLLVLFMPAPLYWLQNVYFADQAVLLPFALAVWLEVLGDARGSRPRGLAWAQGAVFFWGLYTDWLFVFVALVFWLKRAATGACGPLVSWGFLRRSALFTLPFVVAAALFLIQVAVQGGWASMAERALVRTGPLTGSGDGSPVFFWHSLFSVQYGKVGLRLFYVCLALWAAGGSACACGKRIRERLGAPARRILWAGALVLLPCLLHLAVFRNHSHHDFSMAKFALPLALVPFVFLPVLVLEVLRLGGTECHHPAAPVTPAPTTHPSSLIPHPSDGHPPPSSPSVCPSPAGAVTPAPATHPSSLIPHPSDGHPPPSSAPASRPRLAWVAWAVVCCAWAWAAHYLHTGSHFQKRYPLPYLAGEQVARFVRAQTGYADVVYSPDFEIPGLPPQLLSLSCKRVYRAATPADFVRQARELGTRLQERPHFALLLARPVRPEWDALARGGERIAGPGCILVKDVPAGP